MGIGLLTLLGGTTLNPELRELLRLLIVESIALAGVAKTGALHEGLAIERRKRHTAMYAAATNQNPRDPKVAQELDQLLAKYQEQAHVAMQTVAMALGKYPQDRQKAAALAMQSDALIQFAGTMFITHEEAYELLRLAVFIRAQ